ncbi:MAG TPA: hypothetical protein VJN90_06215, partial [Candidatus Acidoferrales bacterium]|nr:hypothetical protein [Candidatus Acidoferrales bacterium]
RPTAGAREANGENEVEKSQGFAITGHHEILLPLLAAALVEADEPASGQQNSRASTPSHRQRRPRAR